MKMISKELIDEIRNSTDIIDIVSNYVSLTPRGKNYFGVCPFHDDNNPSMSVSKEKQIYTCFSCGATGNVFSFLMDYEKISFTESVKLCADKLNIPLELDIKSNKSFNDKNSKLYDIYEKSTKFYQNIINTKDGQVAKKYLNDRGFKDNIIKEFRIGLSLKNRDMLFTFLKNNGFEKTDMIKSGLILDNNYGLSDIYIDRILFPLDDLNGRIVGYSGRIYNSSDPSKYINTKETEIFKKGELLYNYTRAKEEARNLGYVIVMEGFLDVIRAYSIGIKNVVATMGTAVTISQARELKKMAHDVYLCFDGDSAGAKATLSCANELSKIGVVPKIIRLEDDLDPDEYIKEYGVDRFKAKLNNPMNIMDFKLSYLKKGKDLTQVEELGEYINEIIDALSKIEDPVLKEITISKLSSESNLDPDFIKSRLNEITKRNKDDTKKFTSIEKKSGGKATKYDIAQCNLIYYMLVSKEVIKMYDKKITHMPTDSYRLLAREISEYYHKYKDINIADFITYVTEIEELKNALTDILKLNLKESYEKNEIEDYLNTIKEYNIKNQISKLQNKLKENITFDEELEILKQIEDIKRQTI